MGIAQEYPRGSVSGERRSEGIPGNNTTICTMSQAKQKKNGKRVMVKHAGCGILDQGHHARFGIRRQYPASEDLGSFRATTAELFADPTQDGKLVLHCANWKT